MYKLFLVVLAFPMIIINAYGASDSEEEDVIAFGKRMVSQVTASPNSNLSSEELFNNLKKIKLPNSGKTSGDQSSIRECIKQLRRFLSIAPIDISIKEEGIQLVNGLSNGRASEKQIKTLKQFLQNLSLDDA